MLKIYEQTLFTEWLAVPHVATPDYYIATIPNLGRTVKYEGQRL
jgi:hypothetical protein